MRFWLLAQTRPRLFRILPYVRTSQDDDLLIDYSIPDKIREAVNDRSPDISIYNRINERSFFENGENVRDLRLELGAETWSLVFIPDFCLSDV